MTDSPGYQRLTFNAPLSEARADAVALRLSAAKPASILDIGCGWGELLIRIAAHCPGAHARGVDTNDALLARGRTNAAQRGVPVHFENLPGDQVTEPSDLVVCVGSSHALGEDPLTALRALVRPGGQLLLGDGTWEERGPVDRSLVWDDMVELPSIATLVDQCVDAGFRPLWIEQANQDELFAFESGYLAGLDDERAAEHRQRWLHGYRNGFGFAYLTLGVPA